MGCENSNIETNDFEKISRGYNSLIKSVEEEMKEHQKKLNELNYDGNREKEINKEYDQKILDIYLKSSNYQYNYILGEYLSKNSITSAKEFMENEYLTGEIRR